MNSKWKESTFVAADKEQLDLCVFQLFSCWCGCVMSVRVSSMSCYVTFFFFVYHALAVV